ncbi:MAG: hypothetical protein IIB72_01460 [Proteobacteria bacterium]|nr:hypothetical protein [Pseudomonadota bacterium]
MRNLICLLFVLLTGCSKVIQVSDSGYGAFEADIEVLDDTTIALAWYDTRHPQAEIYLRLLDHQLQAISAEFRISESDANSYEVDIVALGANIAATWYELDAFEHSVVRLGLWNREGEQLWIRTLTPADIDARIPVIETVGAELFVAWLETAIDDSTQPGAAAVVAVWIDAAGVNISEPFFVATASTTTWNLNLAIETTEASTTVLLAFDAEHETVASELYVARVSAAGISVNRLTDDDGYASKYPDIALRQGRIALTWFDRLFGNNEIYVTVRELTEISSPRLRETLELGAIRISNTDGDSVGSYLAWNGARLGLTWSDGAEEQHEVYFQELDAKGKPKSEIRRLSRTRADSLIPSISSFGSGFVIGWNEVTVNAHDSNSRLSRSEVVAASIDE